MTKRIIAISGSIRAGSLNQILTKIAAQELQRLGAKVTLIDLKAYPMPLFNQDFEQQHGMPESAQQLKQQFIDHDGIFFACPEYNSSLSPLLKNALDWISRPQHKKEPPLIAFKDKAAAISAASPSQLGGIRGLVALRLMLSNVGMNVVGQQLTLSNAHQTFSVKQLLPDTEQQLLNQILATLIRIS